MKKFEVDTKKGIIKLNHHVGECPYCGSVNLSYGAFEVEDDKSGFYPFKCGDCDNTFREYYNLNFSGNYGYPLKKKRIK